LCNISLKSEINEENLKIPKGYTEAVNRRRRYNTIQCPKEKGQKDKQTMMYKTPQEPKD